MNFFEALYPQSMLVNFLLGLSCLFWAWRLFVYNGNTLLGFTGFFVMSGLSLIIGGFFHGFYLTPANEMASSLWFWSHICSIISVALLQWGSLPLWCKTKRQKNNFSILILGQLLIVLLYRLMVPGFLLVAISFGMVTLHLLIVFWQMARREIKGAKWLYTSMAFILGSGVVFLFKDKTADTLYLLDISHAVLGIGFYQLFLGVKYYVQVEDEIELSSN